MTLSSTRRVAAPAGCSTPASMTTVTSFHSLPTSPPNPASRSPHPTAVSAAAAAAAVRALRTISTVPQLWREWTVGLGDGPSVQGLEDLYGPGWRQAHSVNVMYGRRKVIIDEIRRRQAEGINTGAAVEEVELVRQRGRLSLHQLYQLLNRQKKSAPVVVATLCHSASAAAEERA
jgi:Transcriptional activator of glycolytic enzymes